MTETDGDSVIIDEGGLDKLIEKVKESHKDYEGNPERTTSFIEDENTSVLRSALHTVGADIKDLDIIEQ